MTGLIRYAAALEGLADAEPPPVENWRPTKTGVVDIVIRRDGVWVHEGAPIRRARLVRLLSRILVREGARHFLVTPAEKLEIVVEDAPFIGVGLKLCEGPGGASVEITTNVGDRARIGRDHTLVYRPTASVGDKAPYVHVRRGLEARLSRQALFDLVDLGERRDVDGESLFGIESGGAFFPLCPAQEIFGEQD